MGFKWKTSLGSFLKSKPAIVPPSSDFAPIHGQRATIWPSDPQLEPSFLELGQSYYESSQKHHLSGEMNSMCGTNDVYAVEYTENEEVWGVSLDTNFVGSIFTSQKMIPTPRNFWDFAEASEAGTDEQELKEPVYLEKGSNEYQLAQEMSFVPRSFQIQPKRGQVQR